MQTTQNIVYAVYKENEVQASGSLLDCWKWLLNTYGYQFEVGAICDLAEAGIYIAPVKSNA